VLRCPGVPVAQAAVPAGSCQQSCTNSTAQATTALLENSDPSTMHKRCPTVLQPGQCVKSGGAAGAQLPLIMHQKTVVVLQATAPGCVCNTSVSKYRWQGSRGVTQTAVQLTFRLNPLCTFDAICMAAYLNRLLCHKV